MQRVLSTEQLEAFYHDEFVEDQAQDFVALLGDRPLAAKVVVDIGGGCGFFARRVGALTGCKVRVMEMDEASLDACRRIGVEAVRGDALNPPVTGDEEVVAFNLILHHLVGGAERITADLQRQAVARWALHVRAVFVNEYIYESFVGNLSGTLIFQITKSRILSWLGRVVSTVVPALRANTFGVGVRFRAHEEWKRLFLAAGYDVKASVVGKPEHVALPLRLLLIKEIRRDSFLLQPRVADRTSVPSVV